jgi:P-type Ca2+ transporter type 2C
MWHALDRKEVFEKLKTQEEGLSEKEADKRLKEYGKNELKQIHRIHPFLIFIEQFKSIFIGILFASAIFSLIIQHYLDFGVIMTIVLLNSAIGFFQQYRAERIISKMKELLVPKVKVIRDGKINEIPSSDVVPGDVLILSEGDRIIADCRILHSNELQTDEAALTGESFAQGKFAEKMKEDILLADRKNMLYAGTIIVRGNGKAVVVATGMDSEFGKIAKKVQEIKQERTPLEKKLDAFSKRIAAIVIILTIIVVIAGIYKGEEIFQMVLTGIALAVSVIPEGLPAVISITLALAIGRMQKHNALIRKLPAAETLGRVTVICTDKTGTLTEEKMTVTEGYFGNNFFNINNNSFAIEGKKISAKANSGLIMLLRAGIMCNNARIEIKGKNTEVFGDPTEKALVLSAYSSGMDKKKETEKEIKIKEFPFSSGRKMMCVVREDKGRFVSYVKGAPDIIIKKCTRELINGRVVNIGEKRKLELAGVYEKMASDALRVLGFAYREVNQKFNQDDAENGLIFLGFQGMLDAPRKEVKNAVLECRNAGIKIKMITGDSVLTAVAIAKMINLEGESVEGIEIEKASEQEFEKMVREKTIFARVTPEIKLRIIKILKDGGEIVAVTGDGVNDILALKEAHIGIAMGIRGTDVAKDVSDIILLDDNFNTIVHAIREGRRVYDNMKKSIKLHISANIDELLVVTSAIFLAMPLPFLPLAILWMNLITDSLPSIALSVEKEEENIMKRGPINHSHHILNGILKFIIIAGLLSFAGTIALFALNYQADLGKARTMALTASVFCELFIALSCRSETKPIWKLGIASNKFMLIAIIAAGILQIGMIYSPLASLLGLKAISIGELIISIAVSSLGFIFFEITKALKIKV